MDFKVKTREEGTVPTWGLKKGVRNKRETPISLLIFFMIFSKINDVLSKIGPMRATA